MLSTDDALAHQILAGGSRRVIMATLVFVDAVRRTAYEFGPRRSHRTLGRLPGRDLFTVAHHATAIRLDLLAELLERGPLYHEHLETGEDLGATCAIVRALDGDERQFAFVDAAYCFKELALGTISAAVPLHRVWRARSLLRADHPEVSLFSVLRGLSESALGRLTNERFARRILQYLAGRNGEYRDVPYWVIEARMRALKQELALA